MSVRAYRIKKIEYSSGDTFNLWHDEGLMTFLEQHGFYAFLNDDACGITEVSIDVLKEAIDKLRSGEIQSDDPKGLIKSLQKDIRITEKQDKEWIRYYCL